MQRSTIVRDNSEKKCTWKSSIRWVEWNKASWVRLPRPRKVNMVSGGRGGGKLERARGGWGLWVSYASHIWAHRDWSSKHRAYKGLCQVFCISTLVINLVFLWGSWLWEWTGLWLLCLPLGLFCWVVMTNFNIIVFASFYKHFIWTCLVVIP